MLVLIGIIVAIGGFVLAYRTRELNDDGKVVDSSKLGRVLVGVGVFLLVLGFML